MNLLEAVHRVNVPRAAALLFRGANVNVTDDQGVTPLIIACERGEIRMVDLLLEANASTKMVTNDTQSSCLHIAAKNNAADIVVRLLEADPSIEERTTCQGDTALMLACLSAVETAASGDTLTALLQPRADPSTTRYQSSKTGSAGNTPFLGPDDPRLRARNRHGHTCLHIAAFAQSKTAVRKLLEAGADCTVADKAGRTAMEVAMEQVEKRNQELREGPRGGSGCASACLTLLRDRWTELEKESQERENRLLGELDEAEDGASSGAGKGRRGNGNRVSVTSGPKTNGSKKRKKNKPKSAMPPVAYARGDSVAPAHTQPRDEVELKQKPGEKSSKSAAAAPEGASMTPAGGAKQSSGLGMQKNSSGSVGASDTEGETDDETGSDPSSEEADTSSREDHAEGTAAATPSAAPVATVTIEDAPAARASARAAPLTESRAKQGRQTMHSSSSVSGSRSGGGKTEGVRSSVVADSSGDGESWSVVARATRKKKTAPSLPPSKSLPSNRSVHGGIGSGGAGGRRDGFTRDRGWAPTGGVGKERAAVNVSESRGGGVKPSVSQAASVPTWPAPVLTVTPSSRAPSAYASREAAGGATCVADQPTAVVLNASRATGSPVVSAVVSTPPHSTSTPPQQTAESANIGACPTIAAVAAAAFPAPPLGDPSFPASSAVAVQKKEETDRDTDPPAIAAARGREAQPHGQPRRPLNVNANPWTPPPPPNSAVSPAYHQPPLLYPPQAPHHAMPHGFPPAMHVHQMHMAPPYPQFSGIPPPPQPTAGVGGGLGPCLPTQMMPPTSLPLAPSPPSQVPQAPTTAWGHHQSAPSTNSPPNVSSHGSSFRAVAIVSSPVIPSSAGGSTVNGSSPPLPMPQSVSTVSGNPDALATAGAPVVRSISSSPVPPLAVASSVDGSNELHDGAQAMLEAFSPQAAVVALKVEHLVWDVKAMGAGLSMGQLDTLKAFLLAQVARVDEAKLEQVRVQERSKNVEQANMLRNLHKFQAETSEKGDTTTTNVPSDCAAETSSNATVSTNPSGGVDTTNSGGDDGEKQMGPSLEEETTMVPDC